LRTKFEKKTTRRGDRAYADNWRNVCSQTRKLTANRCAFCFGKAQIVHHLYYRKGLFRRRIYGRETPLLDVVPLCRTCHGIVHEKKHWIRDRSDPDGDHNTRSMVWALRIQACTIFLATRAWFLLVLVAFLVWIAIV